MLDLQSNPIVFPAPKSFVPNRWLSYTDGKAVFCPTQDMQDHMLVWGGGAFSCIGLNLAIMEIKIMAANIFSAFVVKLEGEQTHRDMQMADHMTMKPKGGKGYFVFEHVRDEYDCK